MTSRRAKKSARSPREIDLVVEEKIVEEKINVPFDRKRDYSSIVMQQGRVPLDSDFNEQGAVDSEPQRFKKKLNKL